MDPCLDASSARFDASGKPRRRRRIKKSLKGGAVELSFTGFDIGYDLNLFDDLSYLFFKCL